MTNHQRRLPLKAADRDNNHQHQQQPSLTITIDINQQRQRQRTPTSRRGWAHDASTHKRAARDRQG